MTHHPDVETAITSAKEALAEIHPKRWLDAYSLEDQARVDALARLCDQVVEAVAGLKAEIDWPEGKRTTVRSHNQERLGNAA